MDEVQRQAYLQNCGITLWYSRAPLPGAAPSIEFEFQQASDEAQSGTGDLQAKSPVTVTPQTPEERPKVAAQKAMLSKVVAEAAKPEPVPKIANPDTSLTQPDAVADVPAQSVAENLVSVSLRYAVTDELVLVAQLGDDLPAELQEKLLLQIAGAFGRPVSPGGLSALTWPAFANREVPGNDDRGLIAVLERVLGQYRDRTWFGLGAEVVGLLMGLNGRAPGPKDNPTAQLFFEHDLAELATSGALKRQLWNLMRSSAAPGLRVEH